MSESYVECLVKAKGSMLFKILRIFLYALAVLAFLSLFMQTGIVGVILVLIFGVGGYYLGMFGDVEYEYLYMDKELSVDRILAKTNRKRMGTYSMDRVEIMAPVRSYRLDGMKKRETKTTDYSIGTEEQPDLRYAFYYEGGQRILISPSEEMVKLMKNANPRKVYSD